MTPLLTLFTHLLDGAKRTVPVTPSFTVVHLARANSEALPKIITGTRGKDPSAVPLPQDGI